MNGCCLCSIKEELVNHILIQCGQALVLQISCSLCWSLEGSSRNSKRIPLIVAILAWKRHKKDLDDDSTLIILVQLKRGNAKTLRK